MTKIYLFAFIVACVTPEKQQVSQKRATVSLDKMENSKYFNCLKKKRRKKTPKFYKSCKNSLNSKSKKIKGGLTFEEALAGIRLGLGEIHECYEDFLKANPKEGGKLTVKFVIGANGYVKTSKIVSNTFDGKSPKKCVNQKIQKWAFPKPRQNEPVTLTYPFVFNAL